MMGNHTSFRIEPVEGKQGVYKVHRKSPFSGEMNSMEMSLDVGALESWMRGESPIMSLDMGALESWMRGESSIQNAFPQLNADEREFLMTGITAEEWDTTFQ